MTRRTGPSATSSRFFGKADICRARFGFVKCWVAIVGLFVCCCDGFVV